MDRIQWYLAVREEISGKIECTCSYTPELDNDVVAQCVVIVGTDYDFIVIMQTMNKRIVSYVYVFYG